MNWRDKARLRTAELAEAASVSRRTIARKMDAGEIAFVEEDGRRFIPIAEALRFVGETVPERAGGSPRISLAARRLVERVRREAS